MFIQNGFEFKSLYQTQRLLPLLVQTHFSPQYSAEIDQDLTAFSNRCVTDVLEFSRWAEANPPRHIAFDSWGKRIDQIQVHPGWDSLHQVSAQEGIVSIGYEEKWGNRARAYQFLKLMIFHPSSAFYSCPLAMTDGAATVLKTLPDAESQGLLRRILSRDPKEFITAGQWMTEKTGGSDVSGSETTAQKNGDTYSLRGVKWFTSAVTSEIAMALAQTEVDGKLKLSLFRINVRKENGELNNIHVLRLKEKLGTKAMPTAELDLQGVPATLIGNLGEGIKNIASILNISRLYNAVCATGTHLRLQQLALDYSVKRKAFGKKISQHPLHQLTLLNSQADLNASILFVFQLSIWLGQVEAGQADSQEKALLRFFTPVIKMWTAKKSMSHVSELIESFGGAGYIEDTGLPIFLRDTQVFSIWEGTTNIMSLDSLRALAKEEDASRVFAGLEERLENLTARDKNYQILRGLFDWCSGYLKQQGTGSESMAWQGREWAMAMGDLLCGILIQEWAEQTVSFADRIFANHFIKTRTRPQGHLTPDKQDDYDRALFS